VSTFTPQPDREASDTIRGYVYQVLLTIKRWLDLQPGEVLELECGEDIDLVSPLLSGEERRLLEQVKNYQSPVTLRSAVSSIAYFIEHRQNNPTQNLRFLYTTTAPVGKERPLPSMLKKNEAIFVWEQLRQGSLKGISQNDALQGIRIILSDVVQPKKLSGKTWEVFLSFVKNARDDQLLDLIYSFEWNTKTPGVESVSYELQKLLIERQYPTDRLQAQQQYANLFVYVFKLLSQSGVKKLTVEERTRQLSIQTLSERDRELLNNVVIRVCALESRVGSLEQSFLQIPQTIDSQVNAQFQSWILEQDSNFAVNYNREPPDLRVPSTVKYLSRREETVNALVEIINSHTWTAIYGIVGSGKKQLAILLTEKIGTCRAWIKLCNLNREQVCQELDKAFRELATTIPRSNRYDDYYCQLCEQLGDGAMLVLEYLPKLSGRDELSERLEKLAKACSQYGVRLLSISSHQLPFRLQQSLGEQVLHSMEVPPFSDREAAEILRAYGAPNSVLTNSIKLVNALAQQNPQIISAIALYLRQQNWHLSYELTLRLFKGEHQSALNQDILQQILDSVEDKNSLDLLYRLSLTLGSFSWDEVEAVASVEQDLDRPYDRLHDLIGLWVQSDINEHLIISPLVREIGRRNLSPKKKKACYLTLGELIVSRHQISPQDFTDAIIYFLGAEAFERAGLMLIHELQELNSIDALVDDGGLLSIWTGYTLPDQMDLGIRLYLSGLLVAVGHKYGKNISHVLENLDILLEQASEKEAWAVVGVAVVTNSVLARNDLNRANHYLRSALRFLPYVRKPNTDEFLSPEEVPLELMLWSNARGIGTPEHMDDWLNTVEQLTAEQRQRAFTHEVAERGCLMVSQKVWLRESEKPQEQQDWLAMLSAIENLAERANRLDLKLLWACALRSQIIILGDYCRDFRAAVSVAETAISGASDEPRLRLLLGECVGQHYVCANQTHEALVWLSQALGEDTDAYPYIRMKLLLNMSRVTGDRDRRLAVEFARQAVNLVEKSLAESNPAIEKIDLVRALGELAIAQWYADGGNLAAVFEPWDRAGEHLLVCRSDTNEWKALFVVYGRISSYFSSIATDRPPTEMGSGRPYPAPQQGILFNHNPGIVADYNRNYECMFFAPLAWFAEAVGNDERAATWALRGMDDARATNQGLVLFRLSLDAIPHLLLDDYYAEVLDLAMDAGAFLAAGEQQLQAGQVPQGFELDVAAILGNKPGELWRKAEHNAVLVGLLPIIFRICTVALHNPELAQTQATEVAVICRQVSATAVDQQLWITAADLLEQIHSQEASHTEIIRRSKTFDFENDAVLRAIGYLIATMQNDTPLEKAIQVHMGLAPFVYRHPSQLSAVYRQVILPFFTNYWKIKFESMPLLFHSTEFVSRILNTAENLPEAERVQFILLTVALSLNVRSSPEFAQWVMASAPGVVSFFSSL